MIRKCEFGVNRYVVEKVIMVVGSTGSFKNTLINGLIDYRFLAINGGIIFRFRLITEPTEQNQARSQTKHFTS